jgi:beta-galactosidase
VLIAPSVHICPPATAERLASFVNNGGTLILGPRSGVKEEEGAIVDALLPGLLRPLAGCHVEEYDAFSTVAGLTMQVRDASGNSYHAHGLADVLVPEGGAEPALWYDSHYYAGKPAALRNAHGAGVCYYLGTVLDDTGLDALLSRTLGEANIATQMDLPDSIETTCRAGRAGRFRFYLNHAHKPVTVRLYAPGADLLPGHSVAGEVEVPGFGVVIVKEAI